MAREYFCAYHSYLKSVEPLNDAERGRLFMACLQYSMTGEAPDLRGNERFVFPMMKEQIDRDTEKYEAFRRKQSENIKKRWDTKDTTVYHGIFGNTKSTKEKEKEKEKENIKERTTNVVPKKSFSKPTPEEVDAYCRERRNGIDGEAFVDHYESNGWMIGKTPMKDWKAAVRTWERNRKDERPQEVDRYADLI